MVDALLTDTRFALRSLRRSPGFVVVAVLTLALAIGANTAVFSLLEGVLLRPLPYPAPDRLVRIFQRSEHFPHFPVSPLDFVDYRRETRAFSDLACYTREDLQLTAEDRPERMRALRVSPSYFDVLGVEPAFGRIFDDADMLSASQVVVLSHEVWRRRFHSDPDIAGRAIRLNGTEWTVLGVLPPGFQHVGGDYRTTGHGETVDLWWPVDLNPERVRRSWHYLNVVGRLRPGVSLPEARQDLNRVAADLARRYPEVDEGWSARLETLKDEITGAWKKLLWIPMSAVVLVLLIACANVANLFLARASARRLEGSLRAALGASRGRLFTQGLVESGIVAVAGGVLGVALAAGALPLLARLLPGDFPRIQAIAFDRGVLLFSFLVSAGTALLAGLAPSVENARRNPRDALAASGASASRGHRRLRSGLVVAEVTLAAALLLVGGLLLRGFSEILSEDPGFRSRGVLTFQVSLSGPTYEAQEARAAFYQRFERALGALPGVRHAGFATALPWSGWDENTGFEIAGRATSGRGPSGRFNAASADFFRAVSVPLREGRWFTAGDDAQAPAVVLVNEALAQKYFPGEDAVGKRLKIWGGEPEIVGVFAGIKDSPVSAAPEPAFYWPLAQRPFGNESVVVATDGDPLSLVPAVRAALRRIDATLPIAEVRTLEDVADRAFASRRFLLAMVSVFAMAALLLAALGTYGVLSYAVEQRRRELGIRVALGSSRRGVLWLVLRQSLTLAVAGGLPGCLLAVGAGRALASVTTAVPPADATTFIVTLAAILAAGALAGVLPALRASRTDTLEMLRVR